MLFEKQDGQAYQDQLAFERIMYRQKQVMHTLVASGKLPDFPYDLNQKENQQHFRSLHGFLVEELFEFKEAYSKLAKFVEDSQTNFVDSEYLLLLLSDLQEEFADSLAFALELILYAGITEDDIRYFIKENLKTLGFEEVYNRCLLTTIMNASALINSANQLSFQRSEYRLLDLSTMYPLSEVNDDISIGLKCSPLLDDKLSYHIGVLLEDYSKVTSLLKKKPWRENGPDTDLDTLYPILIDTTLGLFSLAQLYGGTATSIYSNFINKALKNLDRQDKKY